MTTAQGAPPATSAPAAPSATTAPAATRPTTSPAGPRPTVAHDALGAFVGTWNVAGRLGSPPASELAVTGRVTTRWLWGGWYVQTDASLQVGGRTVESRSWTGYDDAAHRYVRSTIDSASGAMLVERGALDRAARKFTFTGAAGTPAAATRLRTVSEFLNPNEYRVQVFEHRPGGVEALTLDLRFQRARPRADEMRGGGPKLRPPGSPRRICAPTYNPPA